MSRTTTVRWVSQTQQVTKVVAAAAERGVQDAAEELLAISQALVPRDTGELAASGETGTERNGAHVVGAVGYGKTGGTALQAISQHEQQDYRHERGQAKYLEQPLFSQAERLGQQIADPIVAALG